jgi:hypothetical protein
VCLVILSTSRADPRDFVDFWSPRYRDPNEPLYLDNIHAPRTVDSLLALFKWKAGNQWFGAKLDAIKSNFIDRRTELDELPQDTTPIDFLNRFQKGGAIWRIFWLHCWNQKFPIYDVNVHRAMTFINDGWGQELDRLSDRKKIGIYLNRYIDFESQFRDIDRRRVDRALFAFGKFLKSWNGPPQANKLNSKPL